MVQGRHRSCPGRICCRHRFSRRRFDPADCPDAGLLSLDVVGPDIGLVNTHLLLGLVFYTLFTGIGLTMRLFGRDPLDRKIDPDATSYWQRRDPSLLVREHFRRQF